MFLPTKESLVIELKEFRTFFKIKWIFLVLTQQIKKMLFLEVVKILQNVEENIQENHKKHEISK